MGTVAWLTRHHVRHRSVALTALALTAALGTTGTLVAAGAADRTSHAYADYRERAHVGDVVINPSLVSREIDRVVRSLPGVESVTSDAMLLGGIDRDVRPRTQAEIDADPTPVLVRGSTDGRYVTMDRPAITQGRLPTGEYEALVTVEMAAAQDVGIGDVLPLSFWSRRTEVIGETGPLPPIGVEHVTVVGIATLPDEVLPDGLYPRQSLIVSPEIAARYDCLPEQAPPDATLEEAILQMAPQDCATSYRFYSIVFRDGDRGVTAGLAAFNDEAAALTSLLPQELQDQLVGYTLVAKTTTSEEERRVDRSTQPIVVALNVLAAAAAAITAFVVGLGVARELGRARDDQLMWWRLGLTRRQRVPILAAPLLASVGAGVVLAIPSAWLLSPVGPVGNVRSIAPSPAREITGRTWLVVLGLGLLFSVIAILLTWRAAHRVATGPARPVPSATGRLARRSGRPAVTEGLRAAYQSNRGAGLVVASGSAAVGAFVAALVFGVSLTSLLSTPTSYGWSWDVATIDNFGYGGIPLDAVRTTVEGRDDVERWTALGFSNSLTLDGSTVPAVLGYDESSDVDIAVVKGHLPGDGEIALGARTAADLGIGLGDSVEIVGYEVPARSATVAGLVVLPALGPYRADRTAPGIGMLVPESMLDPDQVQVLVSFIGIDLRAGTDRTAAFAELRTAFAAWDESALITFDFDEPVRPAEIVDARSMRVSPMLVGGLLVVGATIGLAIGIAMSVRARRRELGVLRVLGFTRGQLRGSVFVQAVASVTGGVVLGVPIGITLGRLAWRAFASRLGVLTEPSTPVAWIAVAAAGAVVIAMLAAALPARAAARSNPQALLLVANS